MRDKPDHELTPEDFGTSPLHDCFYSALADLRFSFSDDQRQWIEAFFFAGAGAFSHMINQAGKISKNFSNADDTFNLMYKRLNQELEDHKQEALMSALRRLQNRH